MLIQHWDYHAAGYLICQYGELYSIKIDGKRVAPAASLALKELQFAIRSLFTDPCKADALQFDSQNVASVAWALAAQG